MIIGTCSSIQLSTVAMHSIRLTCNTTFTLGTTRPPLVAFNHFLPRMLAHSFRLSSFPPRILHPHQAVLRWMHLRARSLTRHARVRSQRPPPTPQQPPSPALSLSFVGYSRARRFWWRVEYSPEVMMPNTVVLDLPRRLSRLGGLGCKGREALLLASTASPGFVSGHPRA